MSDQLNRFAFLALFIPGCYWASCSGPRTDLPAEPLRFSKGEEIMDTVSLDHLWEELKFHPVDVVDVRYNQNKTYMGIALVDILDRAFGESYQTENWNSVAFTSMDGHREVIDLERFNGGDAYLAFAEMGSNGWEVVNGEALATPGPYYLIWADPLHTPATGYAWPWQITEIGLVNWSEIATPDQQLVGESVFSGYKLFMKRCRICHAISQEGGGIGPDLNYPMNILEYRSEQMVRAFIRQSSRYRITRMPDFNDLSPKQMDDLVDYLSYLKEQKQTSTVSKDPKPSETAN